MYSCYVGGGKCSSPRPTNENHHHHHHKREPKSSKKKEPAQEVELSAATHSPYARRRPNENNNGFWFLGEVWSFYPSFSGRTTYRLQYLGVSVEVGTVGTYIHHYGGETHGFGRTSLTFCSYRRYGTILLLGCLTKTILSNYLSLE